MTMNSIAYDRATDLLFLIGVPAFEGTTKAGAEVEFKDVWHWSDVHTDWTAPIFKPPPPVQRDSLRERRGRGDMEILTLLCDPCNRMNSNKLTLHDLRRARVERGADGCGLVCGGEVDVIDSVMGYMIEWDTIPEWVTAVVAVGFGVGWPIWRYLKHREGKQLLIITHGN